MRNSWPSGKSSQAEQPSNLPHSTLHICVLGVREERTKLGCRALALGLSPMSFLPFDIVRIQFDVFGRTGKHRFKKRSLGKRPGRFVMSVIFLSGIIERWRYFHLMEPNIADKVMIVSRPANLRRHVYVSCAAERELLIFLSKVEAKRSSCRSEVRPGPAQLHFEQESSL